MISSKSASASARNVRSISIGPKARRAPVWLPTNPVSLPVLLLSVMVRPSSSPDSSSGSPRTACPEALRSSARSASVKL
jgi:hypothetical protein